MAEGYSTMGDGCRIAWRDDGPRGALPLILSNSLGTTMDMWEPQIESFSAKYRVVRYDTRGHGVSDVPAGGYGLDRLGRDVLELADALEIDHFAFCGLSLGGMTGQWLGGRASARVERLVIANSSPYMGPPSDWDSRIKFVLSKGMNAIAESVLSRWFTPDVLRRPDRIRKYEAMLLATNPAGYAGCCAAIRDMDMRPVLGLIEVPTLVIGGSRDPATPPNHTEQLCTAIIGARCVMLDAAHLSNAEVPGDFASAVIKHLDEA